MRHPVPTSWLRKAAGVLICLALAPLLLSVVAQAITEALGSLAIFALVILVLGVVYRLVLGQR